MEKKIDALISMISSAEVILQSLKAELNQETKYSRGDNHQIEKVDEQVDIVSQTSPEFAKWANDETLPLYCRLYRSIKLPEFLIEYPYMENLVSPKRFAIWIKVYANVNNYGHQSKKGNSIRYSVLTKQE